ncbi:hypothetical protein [Candidatus Mycobacterium methanotrophicum]|uniref:Uncharacterized protein n=2 Tax=Candidatus Mycobacterium methanotrophicum TaxID=2943498 RepID=A0ABY4QKG1_9MYCO|nr:hypothetical protein [Candidatus Mycobacterium methanotrophicum]UQX10732.1 hypothetical protein M5I08_22575 [Candidatus Mycobacterium methanotrophicum]
MVRIEKSHEREKSYVAVHKYDENLHRIRQWILPTGPDIEIGRMLIAIVASGIRSNPQQASGNGLGNEQKMFHFATGAADAILTVWDRAAALLRPSVTAHAVLNAVTAHPQVLLGVLAGVVLTAVVHTVRRIRRVITAAVVMAIAGGGAAVSGPAVLQYLPHWH